MQSAGDATAGAMRAQAIDGSFRKRVRSRIYTIATTTVKVPLPTAAIEDPATPRTPDYVQFTFGTNLVYLSTDPLFDAIAPTTGADGAEEIQSGQTIATHNLTQISLIASASVNVTLTFYWV